MTSRDLPHDTVNLNAVSNGGALHPGDAWRAALMFMSTGRFFDRSGSVPFLLSELSLDSAFISDAAPEDTVVGNVQNTKAGSNLSLTDDAGGRFKLVSGQIVAGATATDYGTATAHNITIRETLAAAANSPRDSVIEIAVGVGTHRYWRIYIPPRGVSGVQSILQLEMYESQFGPNVCTGGTPSASSTLSGTYPASDAFDGNLGDTGSSTLTSLWVSQSGTTEEWLAYDFGAGNDKEIVAIGMFGRIGSFIGQVPTGFSIEYSDDGSTWSEAWSESGLSWSGFEFKRLVNPAYVEPGYSGSPHGAHPYWRFYSMAADNDDAVALAEFQFRATPGGVDQATGGTPSASSVWSGALGVANAFDDDPGSLWSAANNSYAAWLAYEFAAGTETAQVAITARTDVAANTSPGEFAIQWSDDGVLWTTAWAEVGETGWSLGETRTYDDPAYIVVG